MKIRLLFFAFLLASINTKIAAQQLDVTTTTIHKVGQTELKINLTHKTKVKRITDKDVETYKEQWKQSINGSTEIEFNKDITINNIKIKAGKYLILLFPGNDWKPDNDQVYAFPGNDWKPTDSKVKFPGNDWKPKNSKILFPGNDWKPKNSNVKFPGNDWAPLNESMNAFPGNDWLVVFYKKDNKPFNKNRIVAETTITSKRITQPVLNVLANFIYLNNNAVQLNFTLEKTVIAIPIIIN